MVAFLALEYGVAPLPGLDGLDADHINRIAGDDLRAEGKTLLMRAAYLGRRDVCVALYAAGADLETVDIYDWNALHVACHAGQLSVAKFLVRAGGFDVNKGNVHGVSPFDEAARHPIDEVRVQMVQFCRQAAHQLVLCHPDGIPTLPRDFDFNGDSNGGGGGGNAV